MAISTDDAEASDFQLMNSLAADWDTLGWLYFHAQDYHAAKLYLEAAWELSQASLIGEHLVETLRQLERIALDIKVRDTVIYGKYSGTSYTLDGEEVIIIKASDVLARL